MALPTASRRSDRPLGMSLRAVMGFIGMSVVAGVLITVGVTPALALTGLATTNTIGNSVATIVTAKICGEFDENMAREAYARQTTDGDALTS